MCNSFRTELFCREEPLQSKVLRLEVVHHLIFFFPQKNLHAVMWFDAFGWALINNFKFERELVAFRLVINKKKRKDKG